MAVRTVFARRLSAWRTRQFVEGSYRSIRSDLCKGFSSSFEGGGPWLNRTALNEEASPAGNCLRPFSNVAQDLCHDSPRQGSFCNNEHPIASAFRNGDSEGALEFRLGEGHSQVTTVEQETSRLPKDNNAEKNNALTARAKELDRPTLQIGRGGGSVQMMPSAGTASEAISILKNRQQQGIIIDSYSFVEVLKRCSKQKDLTAARQVHEWIIQREMDTNPFVANTLLNAYVQCGRLQDARAVFDALETKTGVTWRIMIGAYAKNDRAEDALQAFNLMLQRGAQPDKLTCCIILNACASPVALNWGKELHGYVRNAGLESDVRVGTALVQMYAKCGCITQAKQVFEGLPNRDVVTGNVMIGGCLASGSLDDARAFFDKMEKRDLVTWSVMIGAYAKCGCREEAYRLFLQMKREGFVPDAITFMGILNSSATKGTLEWVKAMHTHALKAGLESDLRVGNSLIHMYAKSGSFDDARLVFEGMEKRNVITWNSMIGAYAGTGRGRGAYERFIQMKREGFIPDAVTYLSILNASGSAEDLEWVKDVHGHALKDAMESDFRVSNSLVRMYAKCGSVTDARLVFDRMKKRDVITWNIMIRAYAGSGRGLDAYQLFLQMAQEGFIADAVTYTSILNASASAGALEWVKMVHSHAVKAGLETDLRVGNSLVHMYAKTGSFDTARQVFDRMQKRDVFTWNIMIGACAESGCGEEAYQLLLQMTLEGIIPDAITYTSILNASASAAALEWVKKIHIHALKAGLESDLHVANALIHMYAKSGSVYDARIVFDRMERRDVISWNTMIGAYAESGCGEESYELFLQMERDRVIPDAVTYMSILNASGSAGDLKLVKKVHNQALKTAMESDLRVSSSLIHMYAKCGSIHEARKIFDGMKKRDVFTWNIMIGGLAQHGYGHEALELFRKMQGDGVNPDGVIPNGEKSDSVYRNVVSRNGVNSDCVQSDGVKSDDVKSNGVKPDGVRLNDVKRDYVKPDCGNFDGVKPDGTSFVAVLSACCHAGLLDDGRRLFSAMTEEYGVEPTVMHYTCMVDLLGRAGRLEEAMRFMCEMPVEPNAVTWLALLGACRTYADVELGEFAAGELLKLDPKNASAYVLLSNIYAAAGMWEKVSSVRATMQEKGVRKEAGCSWIEVDNKVHEFVVGDKSHPEAKAIYTELSRLTEKLKAEGYVPDTQLVLQNIDEEDKELALCSHSEKLAIAYGLMRTPHGTLIRIFKNLRVCSDCHTATKFISKVTGREIIARDANRFHHFIDGVCSCGDYW